MAQGSLSRTAVAVMTVLILMAAVSQVSEARKCPPIKRPPPPKHRRRPPPPAPVALTRTLTVFGDSLSDDGTNEFPRTNYTVPNPAIYSKGRCSNGPVWAEYLPGVSKNKIARVLNYAYSGAYACQQLFIYDSHLGPTPATSQPLSLANQTAKYLLERRGRATSAAAAVQNIVAIVIGSNDFSAILGTLLSGGSASAAAASGALLVRCILDSVAVLAAAGETQIVVGNLPPADITPQLSSLSAVIQDAVKVAITALDTGLASGVAALQTSLPNTTLYLLDVHGIVNTTYTAAAAANVTVNRACVTTVPPLQSSLYGPLLPNVSATECASQGTGFYFFDREHPTTATHASIAAAISKQFQTWGLY